MKRIFSRRRFLLVLGWVSLLALEAAASEPPIALRSLAGDLPAPIVVPPGVSFPAKGARAPLCQDGVVVDDGTAENGLSFSADTVDVVMLLEVGRARAPIEEVCICWTRDASFGPQVDFSYEIVIYDVDPAGEPGSLLAAIPTTASSVPEFPDSRFYACDVIRENVRPTGELLFVGASWLANANPELFLCADLNGPNQAPIFASGDLGATWFDRSELGIQDIRSLLIRVSSRARGRPFGASPPSRPTSRP